MSLRADASLTQAKVAATPSRGWRWLYALLLLPLGFVVWFTTARPIVVLPRIVMAPGYVLQTADGSRITSESRRGRLTLYSFSTTRCDETCGLSAASIGRVQQSLSAALAAAPATDALPLDMVTISLDPAHDTPGVLAGRAPGVADGALPWLWLTGDPALIRAVVGGGFGLFFAVDGADAEFKPRYVLVDETGIIRAYYDMVEPSADRLMRDLTYLARERTGQRGASRLAYEAAHLFACYPR